MRRLREFIRAAGERGWPSLVGTCVFVLVSILEHFWDHTVASYIFIVLAAAVFCWGAYAAWSDADKQVKEMAELLADRYPRLQGEIVLACLDVGKRWDNGQWIDSPAGSVVTFYVRVVNHSTQDAWMVLPPGLRLTIDGTDYVGNYVVPGAHVLSANDPELKGDRRIL